ncbi:MAG: segregation/condensation protein A [Candidatus Omnitrophota bacterium]
MKIKLEIFEGPLDLLLYLIKKDHLNIYDIPIAKITDQYLQYLELMKLLDLNIAGEFLVMAATLMHIKSKMLLPPEENIANQEEDDDSYAELVKRLVEYKKFKEVAMSLQKKEQEQQKIYRRFSHEQPEGETEVFFEATLFDLITAFSKALQEVPRDVFYEVIKDEFNVEGKMHDLLHVLAVQHEVSLKNLFEQSKNKQEIIATFLAVLELIRLKEIVVVQKVVFGEIIIMPNNQMIYTPMIADAESSI